MKASDDLSRQYAINDLQHHFDPKTDQTGSTELADDELTTNQCTNHIPSILKIFDDILANPVNARNEAIARPQPEAQGSLIHEHLK
jgi:hypothetical protein